MEGSHYPPHTSLCDGVSVMGKSSIGIHCHAQVIHIVFWYNILLMDLTPSVLLECLEGIVSHQLDYIFYYIL